MLLPTAPPRNGTSLHADDHRPLISTFGTLGVYVLFVKP
jgi:hypothetical protein